MPRIAYIAGDGIGPDIMTATRRVLDASGLDIDWVELQAGEKARVELGDPLPDETLASISAIGTCLKGPLTTPVGKGFRSVNVALRKEFDLYANLRPAKAIPGVDCLFPELDMVTVRENTQGLYSSMEHWVGEGHNTAIGIGVNTRSAMDRVLRFSFDYARSNGRKKVTAVHKANIMKIFSGLFLEVAQDVAKDYPDIEFEDRIVDAMAMQMVRDPHQFDVIVSTNLFGDILSDLAAGLIGGLGLAPGANLGDRVAIFEAVHGSAPDIAGKNIANPISLMLAAVLMLRHLGHKNEADRVENAILAVAKEKTHTTPDLNPGGNGTTTAMTDAIVAKLGA